MMLSQRRPSKPEVELQAGLTTKLASTIFKRPTGDGNGSHGGVADALHSVAGLVGVGGASKERVLQTRSVSMIGGSHNSVLANLILVLRHLHN